MTVTRGWRRLCLLATVFIVGAMVIAAFFDNQLRSQNWDPMEMRDYVERAIKYGGSFYAAGHPNKGPLEPLVYRLAAAVTSWDGFWFAISALVLLVCAVLAWAASRTTQFFGGHRLLGVAVGIGVFFHFALGNADYAGTLYARNMIVGLYAGAWLVALSRRWWLPGRARWAALTVGVLLGLGIQTLFVSTIAAIGVGIVALSSIDAVEDETEYRTSRRLLCITPIVIVALAPAYYFVRGSFVEFWSQYWTYNVYQNEATGRSLANQLVYGRDVILRYYRAWPVSLVIVVAFLALTLALWRSLSRRERAVHAGLVVWFVGVWAELVAGQRYSTQYYVILALPTALMAAAIVGHLHRLLVGIRGEFRTAAAWPLLASLLAIVTGAGSHLTSGLEAASGYTSVHQVAMERDAVQPGTERTVRAVLDLVSRPGDPLLAWTQYPWTYLNYRRVAATRFIWKSFLVGEIYLGRTSPAYVFPQTWTWFADDIAQSKPVAFLEETAMPLPDGTPFATDVRNGFSEVYAGATNNVYLRNDVAAALLHDDGGQILTPSAPLGADSNWTIGTASAAMAATTTTDQNDVLDLGNSVCTRISGTYQLAPGTDGAFISFAFGHPDSKVPNMRLNIADNQIFSGDDGAIFDTTYLDAPASSALDPFQPEPGATPSGSADATTATTTPIAAQPLPAAAQPVPDVRDTSTHQFAIVVGKESAAIVIDGAVHAAVRLTAQDHLTLDVRRGGVVLADLHRGPPPANSGCP